MGGKIGLESEVGRGTCVFFTLVQPALSDTSPSNLDHHIPRSKMSVPPIAHQGAKVLLVEDEVSNRRMLTRMLEVAGYVVHAVSSAEDAFALLERSFFDVLVTDISMPGMDGIQLVEALRTWERRTLRASTPAVVVTAHVVSEYQERCREVGVDVFLAKPINGTALRRAVARLSRPPPRVLVVDDSWDARILLEVCLKQYPSPLEIHAANSGATAIATCREHAFSVICIDALMPEMSGIETLQNIRLQPLNKAVKIVAVTALNEREQLEQLKTSGFDDVLTKPIDRHKVHYAVRDALRASVVVRRESIDLRAIESAATLLQLESVSVK
jgi:CheY-like chemotaxis protein